MILSLVKHEQIYEAIQTLSTQNDYPISVLCEIAGISSCAYYKWTHSEKSQNEIQNEKLLNIIREVYEEKDGILGYHQMTIKVRREKHIKVNYKRIYRLMQIIGIK